MPDLLSDGERRTLLQAARRAIADALSDRPPPPLPVDEVFARRAGVFVSLHKHGELRGCIGHIGADETLASTLSRSAVAAATEDPRFPAVTAAEFADVVVEISVLTPFEPVADPSEIEVGRHGLVVEQHWHRGLLLPQVATEYGWDRDAFLEHTCLKAGLPRDAWRHGARIFRFEAQVFGER